MATDPNDGWGAVPPGITAYEQATEAFLWQLAPPTGQDVQGPDPTDLPAVQDDDDLDRVLRDYFDVKLPNVRCCEGHRTPWEAVHNAFFARSAIAVWKASRGLGGKSFTLSALTLVEALFVRADVNILGGSGEQAKRVLESISALWSAPSAPRQCLIGEPGSQKQRLVWGNRIVALMASQTSVRGPHPQRLRMDEVDEMKQTILDSALGQPMSKGWIQSQVVLSSTHQYPDGTMSRMLQRAAAEGWPVFEWCYRENLEPHGWLSLAEVQRKQSILTVAMWNTEIELQEPSSEGRAIDTPAVDQAFQPATPVSSSQTTFVWEDPDKGTWDDTGKQTAEGGTYSTGGDWAKKKNHTLVVTIRRDVRPMRVVAVSREQKKPWPDMIRVFDVRVQTYGGTAMHDNTGLGQVVHDLLNVSADPFDMVGRQRADLLSEYISAIEKGDLIWPRDDTNPTLQAAYSEHKYATRDDIYKGSKDGTGTHHLPDSISAGALAWRAANQPEAQGTMADPTPDPTAPQRGRLTGYVMGNKRPGGLFNRFKQ